MSDWRRRDLLAGGAIAAGAALTGCGSGGLSEEAARAMAAVQPAEPLFFKISLAQWSLHRSLWGGMDNLDFAAKARELDIDAVEYVNQFFADKAEDEAYLDEMKRRADDHGVKSLLIMVDGEGGLAHQDAAHRQQAVINHHKWVRAAARLGCHIIRVNAMGKGDPEEVAKRAVESLTALAEFALPHYVNVVVENHGGWSSDGGWLANVIDQVNRPNCGTLPDFGNFKINLFPPRQYDRYQGVKELVRYAKGVSAKTYDFASSGEETTIDYARMLKIVKDSGYRGYIGIEYEGGRLSEEAGILATRNLLIRHGAI